MQHDPRVRFDPHTLATREAQHEGSRERLPPPLGPRLVPVALVHVLPAALVDPDQDCGSTVLGLDLAEDHGVTVLQGRLRVEGLLGPRPATVLQREEKRSDAQKA